MRESAPTFGTAQDEGEDADGARKSSHAKAAVELVAGAGGANGDGSSKSSPARRSKSFPLATILTFAPDPVLDPGPLEGLFAEVKPLGELRGGGASGAGSGTSFLMGPRTSSRDDMPPPRRSDVPGTEGTWPRKAKSLSPSSSSLSCSAFSTVASGLRPHRKRRDMRDGAGAASSLVSGRGVGWSSVALIGDGAAPPADRCDWVVGIEDVETRGCIDMDEIDALVDGISGVAVGWCTSSGVPGLEAILPALLVPRMLAGPEWILAASRSVLTSSTPPPDVTSGFGVVCRRQNDHPFWS